MSTTPVVINVYVIHVVAINVVAINVVAINVVAINVVRGLRIAATCGVKIASGSARVASAGTHGRLLADVLAP